MRQVYTAANAGAFPLLTVSCLIFPRHTSGFHVWIIHEMNYSLGKEYLVFVIHISLNNGLLFAIRGKRSKLHAINSSREEFL